MTQKILLIALCLSLFLINSYAQFNISTDLRQDCIWDTNKEEWEVLSTNEEMTFFEFNNEFTMFKHTTTSITSAYIIKSKEEDEENRTLEMEIVSDAGNEYLMILDLGNENLRFYYEINSQFHMVHHTIKNTWSNEEDDAVPDEDAEVSSGTGFAISSNGYIVTNYHVINGAEKIDIKGINQNFNKTYSAEVIVSDERNDLAVIKINDPSFKSLGEIPYSFRNNIAEVGEDVFVLGYPMTTTMGTEVKLTTGVISSKTGFQGDIATYQISAPIQSGNSGGPLFDNRGNLIGIVNAKHLLADNAGYAIKINYLKNLTELINNPLELPSSNTISSKTLPDKVKTLSNYVYLISINDYSNSSFSDNSSNTTSSAENSEAYNKKADEEYDKENYNEAYNLYTKSIESDPNNINAYFYRGIILLYFKNNFDLAILDFTKCIQMSPELSDGYFYRGLSHNSQQNYIEAIKDFTQCVRMDNKNTDALFMRAIVKSELRDRQGAINDYDAILRLAGEVEPNVYKMSTVYNNKAYSLVGLGKFSEALPFVNKALDLDTSEAYIWDTRGEIYYNLNDYKKCIKDMDKALSIEESENSYYFKGLAHIQLGNKSEGCSNLSRAGELGKIEAYEAIDLLCK